MWSQQKRLPLLHEELSGIEIIERLREYSLDPDKDGLSEARDQRRGEILAEIAELSAKQPWFEIHGKGVSVALLLCAATAYATIYFFVR